MDQHTSMLTQPVTVTEEDDDNTDLLMTQSEDLPTLEFESSLQVKYDEVNTQCEKYKSDNVLLQDSLDKLKADLEAKNDCLFKMERKYKNVSEELCEKSSNSNSNTVVDQENQLQTVQGEMEKQISSFNDLETQCETLRQSVTEKDTIITCLKTQVENLQTQTSTNESLQIDHNEIVLQCEKFKSENLLLQDNLETLKADLKVKEDLLFDINGKYEKKLQENQSNCDTVGGLEKQLLTLKGDIETYNSNIDDLKKQCETLTLSVTEKEMLIIGLNSELKDLQTQTCNSEILWQAKHDELILQNENQKQKSENLPLQESLENLKSDLIAKDNLFFDMKLKYETMFEEKQLSNNAMMELEKQLETLKDEMEIQSCGFDSLKQQCEALTQTITGKEATITGLKTQVDNLQTQTVNTEASWQVKHDDLIHQCEQHKSENLLLQESLDMLKTDSDAKDNVLVDINARYEKVCGELQAHQSNGDVMIDLEKQLLTLKANIETMTSSSDRLEKQCENLTQSVTEKEAIITELKTQVDDLQSQTINTETSWQVKYDEVIHQCEQHKSENLLLQGSLDTLKTDSDAKDNVLVDMKAQYEIDLEKQLLTLKANIETMTSSSDRLEKQCENLTQSVTEKEAIITELKTQVDDLQSQTINTETSWQVKYDEVIHQCEQHKSENLLLQGSLDTLKTDSDAKDNVLVDMKAQYEIDLEKQLLTLKANIETMTSSSDRLEKQCENLTQSVTEKEAIITELKTQVDDLQSQTINTEASWQVKHDEVIHQCEQHKSENLLLQESLDKLRSDSDAKDNVLVDMKAQYEKVCGELQSHQSNGDVMIDLEKQLLTLKANIETMTSSSDRLEKQCENLTQSVTEKEAIIAELKTQVDDLQLQTINTETSWQVKHDEVVCQCEKGKSENANLQDCLEKLKNGFQTKDDLLFDMETKYEQLSDDFQKKCSELIITMSEKQLKCDAVVDLEMELQSLKDEMVGQTCSFDDLESRLKTLQEDNLTKSEQLAGQVKDKAELCAVLESKTSQLSGMESKYEKLSKELQDKSYELIMSLTEKQFNRDLVLDLEKQVQLLKCEIESWTSNYSVLESEWIAMKAELNTALSDHISKDGRILEVQNEMEILKVDLQARTSMIAELEKSNETLKQSILIEQDNLSVQATLNDQQGEEIEQLKKNELLKNTEAQDQIDNLEIAIVDSKADLETEKQNCDVLRQEIDAIKTSNDELSSAIASTNSDFEKQFVECKEELNLINKRCSSLEDEVESKTELLQQAENKLNLLHQDVVQKDEVISLKEKMIHEMEERLQCDEQRIRHDQEQNESKDILKSRLETAQMDLNKCHEQMERLSSDNNCLKSSVETEKTVIKTRLLTFISEISDLKLNVDSARKKSEIVFRELSETEDHLSVESKELENLNHDDVKENCDFVQEKDELEITILMEEGHKNVLHLRKEIAELSGHLEHTEAIIATKKSSFTSEIAILKSTLESITSDRDSLSTFIKELEQQNHALQNHNEKTDETCKELHMAVSDYELKLSDLSASLSLKEQEIVNLQMQQGEVKAEVVHMSNELKTLIEAKESLEFQLLDMKKQVENSAEERATLMLDNALSQTSNHVDTNGNGDEIIGTEGETDMDLDSTHHLRQELDCVRKENEAMKKDRLEQNLNEECLKVELACMKGDMSNSNLCNESLTNHKFEEKEQLWNLTVEKESLKQRLDETRIELETLKLRLETETFDEREVANLKETLVQCHFDISELRCQLDCLETEKSTIQKDFNIMKEDNVKLTTALQDIQDRFQASEERLQELMSDLNNETIKGSAELNDIQEQYEKLHAMLTKPGSQSNEGNTRKPTSKYTKSLSKSDLKVKPDTTNILKNVIAEKEILGQKVLGLENELSVAKKALEEKHQIMETEQDEKMENINVQGDCSDLKLQLSEVQNEKYNIETERNSLLQKNKELVEEHQRVQDQNKILEVKIEEFSSAARDVRNDLRKLHGVIKDQNESLAKKKKEIVVKANEIETLRTDLAELFTKIQDKQKEIDSLTNEVSLMKKECKESKSTVGTLEDVIEALNLDMAALEDEKSSLTSSLENAEEKVKEQQCELQLIKQSIEEMGINSSDEMTNSGGSGVDVFRLKTIIEELKNDNKELNLKVKEMDQLEIALRQNAKSSQESLEKKCTEFEDLILQIAESKSEIAESTDKAMSIQEKLLQSENQRSELESKVEEENKKVSILQEEKEKSCIALEAKDFEIKDLVKAKEDLNTQLETKREEIMLICDEKELFAQQYSEETKKCETLNSNNESLLCQLGEKEDELCSLLKKCQDSSESLECLKTSVISQLKEKQVEINQLLESQQGAQIQISTIEKHVSELEEEIRSKDDEILKLSTNLTSVWDELQQSKSDEDDINIKIQKCEKILSDKETMLKQMEEDHNARLSQVLEAAEKMESEKEKLSVQLLETQSTSLCQESGKEVLRKWEQQCKELNSNLTMERKRCQGLTEQLNALKASKSGGCPQEIEELKSELEEVKKYRDCMRDERQQLFQKAKEHKDRADLLTCKNRVLTHMLTKKGKAGKSQTSTQDKKVENKDSESPLPSAENNDQTDSKQYKPKTNVVNSSPKVKEEQSSEKEDKKREISEKNTSEQESNFSPQKSSLSIQRKELTSPPMKKSSPLSLRKRTSKFSSAPTLPGLEFNKNTKEGESVLVDPEVKAYLQSESKEVPSSSPPKARVTRISTRKRSSSQSSQSSISKDDMPQSQANEVIEQQEPVSRVTRRSGLRKREATDSLPSVTEDKKSKVIYEDPMTWLEGPSKQAKLEPSLSLTNKSNPSTAGRTTRSKVKETTGKVLNPITNSPVKDGQYRPKGFLRQANKMSEKKAPADQGKDEEAQNCNTQ